MRVTIRKKNVEITPALAEYIEKKILKPLKKLLGSVIDKDLPILDLEVSRTTMHHHKGQVYRMEANLSLGNLFFRAEVEHEDMRAACDLLEKELEREITTEKSRMRSTSLRANRKIKKEMRLDPAARTSRKGRIINE